MSHFRWLAKYTGITEWEIDWEAKYAVHTPGTTAEARNRQCGRAQLTGSLWHSYMSYSLNSLKGRYIGDYIGGYYRAY